jgi:hypothetical protein
MTLGELDLSIYPGASEWVEEVIKNDQIKKQSATAYINYQVSTPMLTSLDSQGENFDIGALKRFAEAVNTSGVPVTLEHDPAIPPIGMNFAASLFQDRSNDKTAVVAVAGMFDRNAIPTFNATGIVLSELTEDYSLNFETSKAAISLALDTSRFGKTELCELLRSKPSIVSDEITDDALKALDVPTILRFMIVPLGALFTRFAWKYGDRMADLAADETTMLYHWLKTDVCHFLANRAKGPTRLVFEARHQGCMIRMVVSENDEDNLQKAIDSLSKAAKLAVSLADQMSTMQPLLLVIKFDPVSKKWIPAFATCKKFGLISSEKLPELDLKKYRGVSVGMTMRDGERRKASQSSHIARRNTHKADGHPD